MGAPQEPVFQTDIVGSSQQALSTSRVPLLGEGFQETSRGAPDLAENNEVDPDDGEDDPKTGKRRLFGFSKKKDDGKSKLKKKFDSQTESKPIDIKETPIQAPQPRPLVPQLHSNHPYPSSSPPNRIIHSSSPRIASPAGSQIFERDVQEATLPVPNSPAIPSHIQTENHIPSVLDASSEAITDNSLDPDSVEIVMASSHHGAAVTLTGVGSPDVAGAPGAPWMEDFPSHLDKEDSASNYGALDTTDVRRLSFISFADVVQSEHAEHSTGRDSVYLAGLTSLSSGHRSPSPMRSPVSSQGLGTSPPTSKSTSLKGVELSPTRPPKPVGSPPLTNLPPAVGSELTIETMSQALRKTGSGDLGGTRSQPISPVSPDGFSERLFR